VAGNRPRVAGNRPRVAGNRPWVAGSRPRPPGNRPRWPGAPPSHWFRRRALGPYTHLVVHAANTKGLGAAFLAYILWGFFPLYFHLFTRSTALEIVAHRIAWTLVFCAIGLTVIRGWSTIRTALTHPRLIWTLLGAGVLVSVNWLIYIYAVVSDQVVDAALGYFINPLITALLAVIFLREKLRRGQLIALVIGMTAVLVIIIGYGRVPWIGLGVAISFGFYSLAKKQVGAQVPAFTGLGIETMALAPVSVAYIVFLETTRQGTFTTVSPWYALLLAGAGVVTAVPLLLFAVGAARISLVTLAFIQYITPVMQFLIGVVVFGEHMPVVRWVGFALVWAALGVLSWDMLHRNRARATQ